MIDVEQTLREELEKLSGPVPPGEWQEVLALAAEGHAGGRALSIRRIGVLAAVFAAFAVLAVATSLGATIAHGVGGFSSWLTGEPGKPASKTAQRAFVKANARSWLGFPTSTKLRRLAVQAVPGTGDTVDLLGFRSGGALCLRVVVSGGVRGTSTSCAPRAELERAGAPVRVVLVDQGYGKGTKSAWYGLDRLTSPALQVTAGIAADGVRSVTLHDQSGSHATLAVSNAFLYVATAPAIGQRVERISARTTKGVVAIPFAPAPFGFGGGIGSGRATGPTRVQRHVSGGTIGWLDRRVAVGQPLSVLPSPTRAYVSRHAVFGRVLDPSPGLPLRVAITLSTSRNGGKATGVCTWLVGPGGGGGGCSIRKQLFSASPLTAGWSLDSGSDEFAAVSGLASDDVARIRAYLTNGQAEPVPLLDNTYIVEIARSQFPVRLVAYDRDDRVIGFTPALQGLGVGAAPARGRARPLKRVTTATGGWAELLTGPATGGGTCMYVHWYESKRATGVLVGCSDNAQRAPLALEPNGNPASLLTGRVRPDVATVQLHYQDGTHATVRPIEGFVIYAVPRAHLASGDQLTGATALSATGKPLGSEPFPPLRKKR